MATVCRNTHSKRRRPRIEVTRGTIPMSAPIAVLACMAVLLGGRALHTEGEEMEGKSIVVADFAAQGEPAKWGLNNSGPKSKVEPVPGPENTAGVQVECVFEPELRPQAHSLSPYMAFRRSLDGGALAGADVTRLSFWHKGDSVQVVFGEKERGDCYYAFTGDSREWRRVAIPFHELRLGWNMGDKGKGDFDLTRMESVHLAVTPPVGGSKRYSVALLRLEYSKDDLDPRVFIGSKTPARIGLYPRALNLPINRTQPLLVTVCNEERCVLEGVSVELTLEGDGGLSPHADKAGRQAAKSLRLVTDAEGKAQARYHPPKDAGKTAAIAARGAALSARAEFTTAPEFHKVHLARDGFFAAPDGQRVVLLGGLFMPQWKTIEGGEPGSTSRMSVIGASEAEQRAWFAYLGANGVNYVRGYWPWGEPLKLGPGGAEILHQFDIDGKVNDPTIAALERTMAIGGERGIGFSLTIADCARHFIGGSGSRFSVPEGKTRRQLLWETCDYLRELVPRLMFNPDVWAYELTNEQGGRTFEWSERFVQLIKEIDEETPVMISHGGGGLQTADPLAWMTNTDIDVYQPHVYPDHGHVLWRPEVDAGLLQEVHYNAMLGPKPWLLGESGGYGTHPPLGPEPDAETQRYLARDCIWFALLNRSIGAGIWSIKHDATTQFKAAAEIAPDVDWPGLARARAKVGVAVPRDIAQSGFFRSEQGKSALLEMARYARWGMENGVTVDFVADAAGYEIQRSALEPFDPPKVAAPFTPDSGYQFKYRMNEDGKLVVGYLRNVAEIVLYKPPGRAGSSVKVTGSYIRVRKPATAGLTWRLPGPRYSLTVWDLDTDGRTQESVAGANGAWKQEQSSHDFLLVWKEQP